MTLCAGQFLKVLARRMAEGERDGGVRLDLAGTALSALGLALIVFAILRSGTWGFFKPTLDGAGPEITTWPMLLAGLGVGALASQLASITVSSVPDEQSGEVGGLQNTITRGGELQRADRWAAYGAGGARVGRVGRAVLQWVDPDTAARRRGRARINGAHVIVKRLADEPPG